MRSENLPVVDRLEARRRAVIARAVALWARRNRAGAEELVVVRGFLWQRITLDVLREMTEEAFAAALDRLTQDLVGAPGAFEKDGWGRARGVLNCTLMALCHDHALHEFCELGRIEPVLEVPLDGGAAALLGGEGEQPGGVLTASTPEANAALQRAAQAWADRANAGIRWPHMRLVRADLALYAEAGVAMKEAV